MKLRKLLALSFFIVEALIILFFALSILDLSWLTSELIAIAVGIVSIVFINIICANILFSKK